MAKLALINREEKRAKAVAKYAAKRAELFAVINNVNLPDEQRMDARTLAKALELRRQRRLHGAAALVPEHHETPARRASATAVR